MLEGVVYIRSKGAEAEGFVFNYKRKGHRLTSVIECRDIGEAAVGHIQGGNWLEWHSQE